MSCEMSYEIEWFHPWKMRPWCPFFATKYHWNQNIILRLKNTASDFPLLPYIYIYANIRWYSFIIVKVRQHYHVSQIPMDQDTIFAMKITSWKPQAEAYLQDPQRCFSCLVSTMKYPWDNLLVTSSPRLLAKLSLKHPMAHGPRWKPMGKIPCNWVLILLKPQNYR